MLDAEAGFIGVIVPELHALFFIVLLSSDSSATPLEFYLDPISGSMLKTL